MVSNLSINFHKSKILGLNLDHSFLEETSIFLACPTMKLPFSFLGIPIDENPCRRATWEPILVNL